MDEGLKNKCYLEAMRLKKSGLDNEVIYARLEKQGIPAELIERVLKNITIQFTAEVVKERREYFEVQSNARFIKAGAGVVLAIVSYFLFPDNLVVPIGCILGGVAFAIFYRSKV
ncbi:MAG: hypothetical protein V4592_15455 [Bacteroidota bacterium]